MFRVISKHCEQYVGMPKLIVKFQRGYCVRNKMSATKKKEKNLGPRALFRGHFSFTPLVYSVHRATLFGVARKLHYMVLAKVIAFF